MNFHFMYVILVRRQHSVLTTDVKKTFILKLKKRKKGDKKIKNVCKH